MMIRDKKLEMDSKTTFNRDSSNNNEGYDKITKEIDSVKVMLLSLKASQSDI